VYNDNQPDLLGTGGQVLPLLQYALASTTNRMKESSRNFSYDYLIAAAAIGSAPAVRRFLAIETKPMIQSMSQPCRSPIRAAAISADPTVVKLLLDRAAEAPQWLPATLLAFNSSAADNLHASIDAAITAQAQESALLLIDFLEKHFAWVPRALDQSSGARLLEYPRSSSGLEASSPQDGSDELKAVVYETCKYGHTTVMRHLLSQNLVKANVKFSMPQHADMLTPLLLAVQYGHRTLVDLLVKHGAKLSPKLLTWVLKSHYGGSKAPMVHHLLNSGCSVNREAAIKAREYGQRLADDIDSTRRQRTADRATTLVYLAHHVMMVSAGVVSFFKDRGGALRKVRDGELQLPTRSLLVQDMAREYLEWLEAR
jgi:hypothetical protein